MLRDGSTPTASTQTTGRRLGRPKSVSPDLIQEAALELFQLNGYEATSVDEIARVAGFSRATFFNYFGAKAEIFWLETDRLLDRFEHDLHEALSTDENDKSNTSSVEQFTELLLGITATISSEQIPWIFRNSGIISSREDLLASGFSRILRLSDLIQKYLSTVFTDATLCRHEGYRLVAAILSALETWIDAGVNREPLSEYLQNILG